MIGWHFIDNGCDRFSH